MVAFNRSALRFALTLACSLSPALAAPPLAILYPNQIIPSPVAGCDNTNFGFGIDMCGSKAAISSDVATFVYSRNVTLGRWIRWAQLDARHADTFLGLFAEVHNDTVVVLAFNETLRGHLDIFANESGIWRLRQALPNPTGGGPLALNARWLVIKAGSEDFGHGAVFVFERQINGTFAFSARLVGIDSAPQFYPREFGVQAAITGDTLLVGAPGDNNLAGAVYVFKFESGRWNRVQKLLASDSRQYKDFGRAVEARGNIAAIAATGGIGFGGIPAAVHMFAYNGTSWQEKQKITDPDPADSENSNLFGNSIALDLQRVVIGEPNSGPDSAPHHAYVFERNGVQWTPTAKLLRAPEFPDRAGANIRLSGNVALMRVGAYPCGPNMIYAYDLYTYATR